MNARDARLDVADVRAGVAARKRSLNHDLGMAQFVMV
jgi:hypothetical protein